LKEYAQKRNQPRQQASFSPTRSSPRRLQAKLRINAPGDLYEQEADRVAERITSMPEPQLTPSRTTSGTSQCANVQAHHQHLLTKSVKTSDLGEVGALSIVNEVLRSSGQPLDSFTRAAMESRFGHDFSRVRVHTDAQAAASAESVNALAFTVGSHVVFGAGQYSPQSRQGRQTLAHELVHTLQQGNDTQHTGNENLKFSPSRIQVQRKLVLTGNPTNVNRVLAIMDKGLSPLHAAAVNAEGVVKIITAGKKGQLTPQNKAFSDELQSIVSEPKITSVGVISGGKNRVMIGNYELSQIDVADLEQLGIGQAGVDARASLIHELVEQREKQQGATEADRKYGSETTGAHGKGRSAELGTIGATYVHQLPKVGMVNHSDGTQSYTQTLLCKYPDGTTYEVELTISHNDIVKAPKRKKKP
jgi:Domain of unknown function (DUF4157)